MKLVLRNSFGPPLSASRRVATGAVSSPPYVASRSYRG